MRHGTTAPPKSVLLQDSASEIPIGAGSVSFVVLSWNSERYLERCLDSVMTRCEQERIQYEILVVDNGSSDGSTRTLDEYRSRFGHRVLRILLRQNLGTTYPRNLALKRARGEFVCVLDSDTEILDGRLDDVLWQLTEQRDLGIVAPRLVTVDGMVQNSVKMFPTLWQKLLKLRKILLRLAVTDPDYYPDFPFSEQREVESAISACWFFRRDLVDHVGYLDERIFYAPEDLDFCLRVWRSGYRIVYDPSLTVLHKTQQLTHRRPLSRISLSHAAGLLYYFRKHGGWLNRVSVPAPRSQPALTGRW